MNCTSLRPSTGLKNKQYVPPSPIEEPIQEAVKIKYAKPQHCGKRLDKLV